MLPRLPRGDLGPAPGRRAVEKFATPVRESEQSYPGLNFFHCPELSLFRIMLREEFTIDGFQARQLRLHLPGRFGSQLSRS